MPIFCANHSKPAQDGFIGHSLRQSIDIVAQLNRERCRFEVEIYRRLTKRNYTTRLVGLGVFGMNIPERLCTHDSFSSPLSNNWSKMVGVLVA